MRTVDSFLSEAMRYGRPKLSQLKGSRWSATITIGSTKVKSGHSHKSPQSALHAVIEMARKHRNPRTDCEQAKRRAIPQ